MKVAILDSSDETGKIVSEKLEQESGLLTMHYHVDDIDGFLDKLQSDKPDVLLLDIELPNLAGQEILSEIMEYQPLPVIVTCFPTQKGKLGVIQSIELGAIDFITKPTSYFPGFLDEYLPKLIEKIKIAEKINIDVFKSILDSKLEFKIPPTKKFTKKTIVLGLDNTALEAFRTIVTVLPRNFPNVLAVLDLPAGYTKLFADRLNEISKVTVKEANENDELTPGTVLIAPGDFHMKVNKRGNTPYIEMSLSQKVNNRRPSSDVTMMSVAENVGKDSIGVLASGFGEDGVVGLKSMKMSGADTIIFNPENSVIRERLTKAEEFDAFTHKVDFKDFPELIVKLI